MRRLFVIVCAALLIPVTALALFTGGGLHRSADRAIAGVGAWLPAVNSAAGLGAVGSPMQPELPGQAALGAAPTHVSPGPALVPPAPALGQVPPSGLAQTPAMWPSPGVFPPVPVAQAPVAQHIVTAATPLRNWFDPNAAAAPAPASPGPLGGPAVPAATAPPAVGWGALPETADPSTASVAQDGFDSWGAPPAPALDPRRFTEAHWQGLELIPRTTALAKVLRIPPDVRGVIVDDATLPADLQGFLAGDVVTRVAATPTPDLLSFVQATDLVRDLNQTDVEIFRDGAARVLVLTALMERLGNANGETPPVIQSASRPPHAYQGACTNCHRIGTTPDLAMDQGDALTKTAPPIRPGNPSPHRPRGQCSTCHQIVP